MSTTPYFKKFDEESLTGRHLVKTSVSRNIRKAILNSYPSLADELQFFLAKKAPTHIAKYGQINIVLCNDQAWFFQIRKGPYIPTLRLLHRYPDLLPKVQVDRGAIEFVMVRGANVMSRGVNSPGGILPPDLKEGTIVAIHAEGKTHACAIGLLKASSAEIKSKNSGIGMDNLHHLGDGLWHAWAPSRQEEEDEEDN